MKKEISSLELIRLNEELQVLIGCKIDNIYHKDKELRIRLVDQNHKRYDLFASLGAIFLTNRDFEWEITNFAMLLRKYLRSKTVISINQYKFDRVVEIKTEDSILIIEMFRTGNFVLVDSEYSIIMPLELQRWKTRKLVPKEQYKFPESIDIRNKSIFSEEVKRSEKKIVAFLAEKGFGKYAEELLEECGLDKNLICNSLDDKKIKSISSFIDLYLIKDLHPSIIKENGEIIDFSIFNLKKYHSFEKDFYPSISSVLDLCFEEKKEDKDYILESQEKALKKFENEEKRLNSIVEYVNNNYEKISKMQETVEDKINIEGFEINKNVSIQKNVSNLYEKIKKIQSKIENLKKEMNRKIELKNKKVKFVEEKKWFHKYFYFTTSDGFLVVAGKDDRSNEDLIKKHLGSNDVVFHAEIHGASFVVIKIPPSLTITQTALEEAAQYSAVRCKAWQMGLGSVDVYWVKPEQLTKETGSLGKGSFIVNGEKNYFKSARLEFGIGLKDNIVVTGPYNMIRKTCKINCLIVPGNEYSSKQFEKIRSVWIAKANEKEKEFIKSLRKEDVTNKIPAKCRVIE